MQGKNYFKMIIITQNTFYTYGNTNQCFKKFKTPEKKMLLHKNPSPSHLHIYFVKFEFKTKICYLLEPLVSLCSFLDV